MRQAEAANKLTRWLSRSNAFPTVIMERIREARTTEGDSPVRQAYPQSKGNTYNFAFDLNKRNRRRKNTNNP